MNPLQHSDLDTVIPGIRDAYARLRSQEGKGLYTSRGSFYNKTIFGRDAAMSAKFVADFDHQAARDVIRTLVGLQGVTHNSKTQEEPGRIHHEWRNFRLWRGSFFERLPFWVFHSKWNVRDHLLLTYFSLDTTAGFIRLVHKYATHIDESVLDMPVKNKLGGATTVRAALEAAAEWIVDAIDDNGLVSERRSNEWSLPFQTFQDSFYTRSDGSLANHKGRIAYLEVQGFAADALYDMAHLMPDHEKYHIWRETAIRMHYAALTMFRRDDLFLASAIDQNGQIDVPNVSAGWILNTFIWHEIHDEDRKKYIAPIVERLFSDEFLTPVGLRTRSLYQQNPIKGAIDYHGSETVWPMFSFMVIEGLRRHRMYTLAQQLENRVINGLNAVGNFAEFHIVTRDGIVVVPSKKRRLPAVNSQMKPEQNIGFSVVPAMVMAWRTIHPTARLHQKPWQTEVEEKILKNLTHIERVEPVKARNVIGRTEQRRIRRWSAGVRVIRYFWQQRRDTTR